MTDRNEALRLAEWHATEQAHGWRNAASLSAADKAEPVRSSLLAKAAFHYQAATLLRQLSAERDQLRAEVERLRVDAERLDWLEKCPATQLPKDSEAMRRWLWHRPAGAGNIRAAIDHARTTHKDEG